MFFRFHLSSVSFACSHPRHIHPGPPSLVRLLFVSVCYVLGLAAGSVSELYHPLRLLRVTCGEQLSKDRLFDPDLSDFKERPGGRRGLCLRHRQLVSLATFLLPPPAQHSQPGPVLPLLAMAALLHRQTAPNKPPRKRNVVSRGRTGCLTCRRRRLKCDEAKPGCNNVNIALLCYSWFYIVTRQIPS